MEIPRDWTFKNADVAAAFDNHVREQLPWYDLTTGIVAHIARHYIPEGGLVYDVGASTGNIGRALSETLESRKAKLIGIEPSAEMAAKYCAPGELIVDDATNVVFRPYDVAICFLVLMFLRPGKRAELLRHMRSRLNSGGAIIIFDKSVPELGYPSVVMQRLALAGKVAAGVPAQEVLAKELSLAGAQRPLHRCELPPKAIEVFRFGDFAGWLIEGNYPTATDVLM